MAEIGEDSTEATGTRAFGEAGATPERVKLAQAVCVNALAAAALAVIEDSHARLALDILAETEPLASVQSVSPAMAAVLSAARATLAARDQRGSVAAATAQLAAHAALSDFFFRRMAAARDTLHPIPAQAGTPIMAEGERA